jgi:hypothetical protein
MSAEPIGTSPEELAVSEYQASRARYIRTITTDLEQRLQHTIGKRREPLVEEIANLTVLAHGRYEVYQDALKAYAAKAPARVKAGGIQAPTPAERMISGIDKLYKAALKAAEEFRECDHIIKKRKHRLEEIDYKMRVQLEQYGRDLIAQLETPAGLEGAFKRDPLLGRAHARMLGAQARRTAVVDAIVTAP